MFVMENVKKNLILVTGLMLVSGLAQTVAASCEIKKVCEMVEAKKKDNESLTDVIKEEIEEVCEDKMHKTDCPVNDVILACWEGGEDEALAICLKVN